MCYTLNRKGGLGMYQKKTERDIRCPLEYGMEIFGGKWKTRIICVLAQNGWMRYSQIRSEMTNITDAVLAATLKELLASKMIARKQYDEIPPRVEYNLTERGRSVVPILRQICTWSDIFYNDDPDNEMKCCEKCNYRG